MKVVLLKNVKKLGDKYDIKEVKEGYARNYLIPNGLAKKADESLLRWAKEKQREIEDKASEELEKIGETATKLDGMDIEMEVKAGDEDQLFEKITEAKIAKHLKEMGFEVKKSQVQMDEPIKEVGEHSVKVKFDHNLESEIKVIIVPIEE